MDAETFPFATRMEWRKNGLVLTSPSPSAFKRNIKHFWVVFFFQPKKKNKWKEREKSNTMLWMAVEKIVQICCPCTDFTLAWLSQVRKAFCFFATILVSLCLCWNHSLEQAEERTRLTFRKLHPVDAENVFCLFNRSSSTSSVSSLSSATGYGGGSSSNISRRWSIVLWFLSRFIFSFLQEKANHIEFGLSLRLPLPCVTWSHVAAKRQTDQFWCCVISGKWERCIPVMRRTSQNCHLNRIRLFAMVSCAWRPYKTETTSQSDFFCSEKMRWILSLCRQWGLLENRVGWKEPWTARRDWYQPTMWNI